MPASARRRSSALTILAGIALTCTTSANATWQWVSINTLPGFNDAQAQLQSLVNQNGHHPVNRLCVIGQKDGAHFQAEVYWPEENKLILWIPNLNDPQTLVHSKRYLDLKRDVRANTGTSTYLQSSAFVAATLKACAATGTHFMINKTPAAVPNNG